MVLGVLLTLVLVFMALGSLLVYYNLNPADDEIGDLKETLRRTSEENVATRSHVGEVYDKLNGANAEIGELKETLRWTIEEKTALQGQLADLKKALRQTAVELGEKSAVPTRPAEDKPGRDTVVAQPGDQGRGRTSEPSHAGKGAYVTAVDNLAKTASINLGAEDGVAEGMVFLIYNAAEDNNLARLTIRKVSKKSATGDLSIICGGIKVNDNAARIPHF